MASLTETSVGACLICSSLGKGAVTELKEEDGRRQAFCTVPVLAAALGLAAQGRGGALSAVSVTGERQGQHLAPAQSASLAPALPGTCFCKDFRICSTLLIMAKITQLITPEATFSSPAWGLSGRTYNVKQKTICFKLS